jgi:peroxiredoxin
MVAAFGVARQTENREAVNQYLAEYGLRLPMLYVADSVLQELGLIATPTTFIVNRDGVVTEVWTGLWSNDDKIAVHDSLAIVQ